MVTEEVKAECRACGATGVYQGFAEGRDEAVVCLECDGTGCKVIRYTPFTKRRLKRGVKVVRRSRGSFIATGVGGTGRAVTYAEFQTGKMPD
jgi:hypothetical protein